MATFKELKAQMAELEAQAAVARAAEFDEVLADVRAKLAEYGFKERDIFGRRRGRPRKAVASVLPPKDRGYLVRQRAAAGLDQEREKP